MKTQYYTAASLDGFIAGPGHSLDWLMHFGDPGEDYNAFINNVGAIAMGSHTYEWLWRNHLQPEGKPPGAWMYTQPAWVFSSRPQRPVPGADIRFVHGDVRPIHQQMAAAANGKNIWLVGGGELVGQFLDAGLLDELIVTIAAVTLGAGLPLLPRSIITPPLKLLSVQQLGESFAQLRYAVPRNKE